MAECCLGQIQESEHILYKSYILHNILHCSILYIIYVYLNISRYINIYLESERHGYATKEEFLIQQSRNGTVTSFAEMIAIGDAHMRCFTVPGRSPSHDLNALLDRALKIRYARLESVAAQSSEYSLRTTQIRCFTRNQHFSL